MLERAIASSRVTGNENALTFGQFVPIFLLGYTVLVFREAYYGRKLRDLAKVKNVRVWVANR